MNDICYYLKNTQCIPIMAALHHYLPDKVVASRPQIAEEFLRVEPTPNIATLNFLTRRYFDLAPISKTLQAIIHAKIVIFGVTNPKLMSYCHGKKVMVFHGTFRYITDRCAKELALFDMVWVNSPRQARMIDHYAQGKTPYQLIGYLPFLEFSEKTPETIRIIQQKLNLSANKITAVYLPARRNVGSWCNDAIQLATEVPDDIQLIMRPHPNQLSQTKGHEQVILTQLEKIIQQRPNIHLDKGLYPYNDLLCIADVVISDATSPAEESLYYDAAQLFTRSNSAKELEKQCQQGGMPQPEIHELLKLYDCGIDLSRESFANWGDAIYETLKRKDQFAYNRHEYFKRAFGEFSKADIIQRLQQAVMELKA